MEFHEKLQVLRKQRNMTQEELAQVLFVSRTAISKWESGRGMPSIDSVKAIAAFFSVTIDELLSSDQALRIAEEENKKKAGSLRDLVFGLLDCGTSMLLILPLFGQSGEDGVRAVPLLALSDVTPWLRWGYFGAVLAMVIVGILALALQNCQKPAWLGSKVKLSLGLNLSGMLLLILGRQPYGAIFLLIFLTVKVFLLSKKP